MKKKLKAAPSTPVVVSQEVEDEREGEPSLKKKKLKAAPSTPVAVSPAAEGEGEGKPSMKNKRKAAPSTPVAVSEEAEEEGKGKHSVKKKMKSKPTTPRSEVQATPSPGQSGKKHPPVAMGAPSSAAPTAASVTTGSAPSPPFVKSSTFRGACAGYVFKAGEKGVGYYKDDRYSRTYR
mmetsp:Transcript_26206/g.63390  ORF Transcript_26206/g.63390 Transcript_26206/m.63390 type:complete len:178 (-) Transcript_26206:119-652(-)